MTKKLQNPSLPPGAVISVDPKTDIATRNDGVALQPADSNPWYVLATIAGKQQRPAFNRRLHARNRRYWNGWACAGMNKDTREKLAQKMGLDPKDLAPLSPAEQAEIRKEFDERLGKGVGIPPLSETINFSETHFSKPFSMEKCVLAQMAAFRAATFSHLTTFASATFSDWADFDSATFSAGADFASATFSDWATFNSVTFSTWADFASATFGNRADFAYAPFSAKADFTSAKFDGEAEFSHGCFDGETSFKKAKFKGKFGVPTFYGRSFYHKTYFTTEREYWPEITPENAEDSKQAYTRLRQIMNELHKTDAEAFFGRQELRCDAETNGWFFRKLSQGYGAVSDYGHSILRPLLGLGFVILLGWLILGSRMAGSADPPGFAPIAKGLGLSISNTFAFFGFQRLYFGTEVIRKMPGWTHWLGAMQTVAGFILVFLLGLGLRNRFRLR